jgi:ribosomal-protein-alanine N-acetyltransferase
MTLRVLESPRLTLVAATPELVAADLKSAEALGRALAADVPDNWPPRLYERTAMRVVQEQLEEPAGRGWSLWYLITRSSDTPRVIGICGFKGRPDSSGSVEIGYSVLDQFQLNGFATEAVARLVTWAFSHQSVNEVTAETLPHLKKSIRVMEKNGFRFVGPGSEQGVVRYAIHRTQGR